MKSYVLGFFLSLICASASSVQSQKYSLQEVIKTEQGLVSGVKSKTGDVLAFKGIPFAAPPVGALRWKAPHAVVPWKGIRECTEFSASPFQSKPVPFNVYTSEFLIPESPISEDCLYLNIWTKIDTAGKKNPVFVWIYGGGFNSGGAGVPIYDGESLARKGVVFVSINYRVGIFGFFAHPELSQESPQKASGNYGLMDQISALQWIQQNIEAFGGDKSNVTIAGQSAGSTSVNCLVGSPAAKGLFHKAIAESGANLLPTSPLNTSTLSKAELVGKKVSEELKAVTLLDLRALPAHLLQDQVKQRFGPIVDGYILPQPLSKLYEAQNQADIPLLTGWNADEAFVQLKSKEDFVKEAQEKFGSDLPEFLSYYPSSSDEEAEQSQVALARDRVFAISNYRWAGLQSERKNDVYVYYFTRKPPATAAFKKYKSFHTAEVGYALGNLSFINREWEPIDYSLSSIMSSYWVNFARSGNPNGKGLPAWPLYTKHESRVIILREVPTPATLPSKAALDFLLEKEIAK